MMVYLKNINTRRVKVERVYTFDYRQPRNPIHSTKLITGGSILQFGVNRSNNNR